MKNIIYYIYVSWHKPTKRDPHSNPLKVFSNKTFYEKDLEWYRKTLMRIMENDPELDEHILTGSCNVKYDTKHTYEPPVDAGKFKEEPF